MRNLTKEEIDSAIMKLEAEIRKAPNGVLRISNNHGNVQYYHIEGKGGGKYISVKKQKLIRELAQKTYDKKCLEILKRRDYDKLTEALAEVYTNMNSYRKAIVKPYWISDEEFARRWQEVSYEGKKFEGDAPELYSDRGERVRSKSERDIANKLNKLGIPYRYEYPHVFGEITVYSDFTILHKETRREIILEHFGRMSERDYAENFVRKINLYSKNGYVFGDNLLATYECENVPLDTRVLERLLKRSF